MNLDRIKETALIHKDVLEAYGDDEVFYEDVLRAITGFYVNKGGEAKYIEEKDSRHEYVHNSWGCRDEEFTGPVDILAAGCSMTYGQGIPIEHRWSSILGETLDATTATLAVPGWSTQSMVNAVMNYIIKFGKPKAVALWLPDFFRVDYVTNKDLLVINKNKSNDEEVEGAIGLVYSAIGHIKDTPKISKKPHLHEDVLNSETTAFLAGQSLRFLVEYCKEAKIELVYSTWDLSTHQLISYVDSLYKKENLADPSLPYSPEGNFSGYVDAEYYLETNQDLAELNCHSGVKERAAYCFDWGTDIDGHVGTHMHAHVAEKFANRLGSIF